jgi:tetratricopeptide (TPR) repeat protein
MKNFYFYIFVLLFAASCSSSKQFTQLSSNAQKEYTNGNFEQSLSQYENIIALYASKNKEVDGSAYLYAGLSAWELKQSQKAIDYLEKAKQTPKITSLGYLTLAKAYFNADNLSREISNLEEYIDKFPSGTELSDVRKQLFTAYVRSENWEPANSLWTTIGDECQNSTEYLVGYLSVCRKMGLDEQRDKTAQQILKLDKKNVDALEVLADKYFWLAENRYQSEMKTYNSNRTNKQYSILLKALETINENFKVSRDYYLRLWEIEKNPKYATYLGNIYSRFDNKERSDYFYRQAKKN